MLERTHPFHFKMTPAAMAGPCSNHDLGFLFRFPTKQASLQTRCGDFNEEEEMVAWIAETITDHEYYAGGYMGKDLPQAQGLLHCLHDAKLQFDRAVAAARDGEHLADEVENQRRLFHRLIFSMNKRHHVGFQTIYAYLLGKPFY